MDTLLGRITIDPTVCHGKPCVRGLRYPVETLLELLSSGMTIDDILADYEDLEREDLLAVLAYAARLARTRRLLGSDLAAEALEQTRVRGHRTWSTAASVGPLSAHDGWVVLDRQITVHGFGGTIETGAANASPRTYADSRTNAPLAEEQLLARFGHRHRSAFLLCKAVTNAVAFVISQDGDLPVFSSDDRHVYCDENLTP